MTPDSCAALISECTTTPPFWEAHCTVKLIPSAANLYAPHGDSGLLEPYQTDWDLFYSAYIYSEKKIVRNNKEPVGHRVCITVQTTKTSSSFAL